MNIQENAEQYACEKLGNWCHVTHSAYEIEQCTNGEISMQDYIAGFNEAKRWLPVSERRPVGVLTTYDGGAKSEMVLVRLKNDAVNFAFHFFYIDNGEELMFFEGVDGKSMYNVKE